MQPYKRYELDTAKFLNGTRRKQKRYKKQGPDVSIPGFEVECKLRKKLPEWLINPLRKTQAWRSKTKPGVVVWFRKGDNVTDGIVVMDLVDFKALIEKDSRP